MGRPGAAHGRLSIRHNQLALFGRNSDYGEWATLTLTQCLEQFQRFGRNSQHIALLAFVAPNLFGRHAGFFQWHGAQIKTGTTACIVGQLRKGIAQATGSHVVDGQNRVTAYATGALPQHPALVDDFLRAALDFGVATLHGIKVQLGGIGAGGHGAGGAAAHADAHARAAQLDEQAASRKFNLVRLRGINNAQAAGNHDGLVVAAQHAIHVAGHGLLVFAEVTQQVGPAKLVVEGRAAQGAFDHDLQRAGNVLRLSTGFVGPAAPQLGHRKTGQASLGFRAAPRSAFIANLTPSTGRSTGERRNGCWVVVGLHLHQNVVGFAMFFIARRANVCCATCAIYTRCSPGHKALDGHAFHHRRVVRIGHQHVLRVGLMGVADHAKHGLRLRNTVNRELGVENLVPAVLAVGLGKHHQFHVGRVAPQRGEGIHQVIDLICSQRQAKAAIGFHQCRLATGQHIHMVHGRCLQRAEQAQRLGTLQQRALGHAVMQNGSHVLQLLGAQRVFAQQTAFQGDAVFDQALNALDGQTAVVRNICRLGGPGRNGA